MQKFCFGCAFAFTFSRSYSKYCCHHMPKRNRYKVSTIISIPCVKFAFLCSEMTILWRYAYSSSQTYIFLYMLLHTQKNVDRTFGRFYFHSPFGRRKLWNFLHKCKDSLVQTSNQFIEC